MHFNFHVETEQGVAQAIIRSVIDFRRDPWPRVSENAKDLVRKMLNPDPKRRLTAQEVLGIMSTDFICINLTSGSYSSEFTVQNLQAIPEISLCPDHPWLQNAKKAPNVPLGETVKARLKQFSVMNKLKKRALRVITKVIWGVFIE